VKNALNAVKYPGFTRDIVSFGLVKSIQIDNGDVKVQLGLATNDPNVPATIKNDAERALRTIEGIRRIIGKLSPLVLQELGLVAAIRKEAKDFARNTGVKARVMIAEDVGRLASGTEQAIYRVVQEALHNVAKHAQDKNVTVQVERADQMVQVVVEDDGVGIQSRCSNFRDKSAGLVGIYD